MAMLPMGMGNRFGQAAFPQRPAMPAPQPMRAMPSLGSQQGMQVARQQAMSNAMMQGVPQQGTLGGSPGFAPPAFGAAPPPPPGGYPQMGQAQQGMPTVGAYGQPPGAMRPMQPMQPAQPQMQPLPAAVNRA